MKLRLLIWWTFILTLNLSAQNSIRQQIDKERDGSFLDAKTYEKARGFIRSLCMSWRMSRGCGWICGIRERF